MNDKTSMATEGKPCVFRNLLELWQKHEGSIYKYVRLKLGNDVDTELVMYSILLKLTEIYSNFQQRSSPLTFLYGIARNKIKEFLRKKRREPEIVSVDAMVEKGEDIPAPLDVREYNSVAMKVNRTLMQMKQPEQDVLIYRFCLGFSIKEISEIMNKKEWAIKKLIVRSLRKFRQLYQKKEGLIWKKEQKSRLNELLKNIRTY